MQNDYHERLIKYHDYVIEKIVSLNHVIDSFSFEGNPNKISTEDQIAIRNKMGFLRAVRAHIENLERVPNFATIQRNQFIGEEQLVDYYDYVKERINSLNEKLKSIEPNNLYDLRHYKKEKDFFYVVQAEINDLLYSQNVYN